MSTAVIAAAVIAQANKASGVIIEVTPADFRAILTKSEQPLVVTALGGCTMVWHGKEYVIDKIEPLDTETGRAAFPPPQQLILRLLGRKHFEKMRFQQ